MSERVGEKKGIWHSQRKLDENGWTRFARLGTATDSYYVEQNSYGFLLRRTENIIDVIYIFNRQKKTSAKRNRCKLHLKELVGIYWYVGNIF